MSDGFSLIQVLSMLRAFDVPIRNHRGQKRQRPVTRALPNGDFFYRAQPPWFKACSPDKQKRHKNSCLEQQFDLDAMQDQSDDPSPFFSRFLKPKNPRSRTSPRMPARGVECSTSPELSLLVISFHWLFLLSSWLSSSSPLLYA